MRRTGIAIAILACIQVAYAIRCWKCDNALDNDDCLRKGRAVWCRGNQHGCQSEVRYHWGFSPPIRITKRCKQGLACGNNVGQNEKGFFPFQCNPRKPESICRCCCDTDDCNMPELGCLPSYPDCRELVVPDHGSMDCHFGTLPPAVGEECQFKCDPGYELIGAFKLKCNALTRNSADWSDDEPTCQPLKCEPEYIELEKGYVQCTDDNNVHSECDWECEPGYAMKGHSTSTCMESQNWDYPMPECIPVVCPPPLTPNPYSTMECSDGDMAGSTCSFTCEEGYVMQGLPDVLCNDDFNGDQFGVWSSGVPKCVPLLCQPQSRNPTNGRVFCTNANFGGSECSYSCDTGFAPSGPPSRVCEDDNDGDQLGRWSNPEPECRPVRCVPDQRAPENGVRNCDNQNYLGSVCEFFCNDGLALKGSSLSICQDDNDGDDIGVWSDPVPTCEPDPCQPEFTNPLDGRVSCTDKNNYRSTCSFTCNRGFYMMSEAGDAVPSSTMQSVCGKFGEWTKQAPTCEPIKCNPPQREDDILFVDCSDDNNYLSRCRFDCKDGSKPEGNPQTVCQDDGNGDAEGIWEPPSRPSCRPRICQPPQIDPQNGRVSCSEENFYGSVCSFSCNPGFYLVSPGGDIVGLDGYDVECGENIEWNRAPPTCEPIVCLPKHTNPNNGYVRCTKENNYLSRCDFKCDAGFEMIGMPETLCNDMGNGTPYGEWSSPAPTCENTGCQPPLVEPENGGMRCSDGSNFKSVCSFTCNPGYYLVNSRGVNVPRGFRSQCQADNTWSETEPTCRPITCPPARTAPANGAVSCTDGIQWRSDCSYTCDNGYKLNSVHSTTECQDDGNGDANGKWSRPVPKCLPTSCSPKQVAPNNGKISCTNGNTFGSVCTFTCKTGYYMSNFAGNLVRTNTDSTECMEGAKWSRLPPKCAPIKCNPPHNAPLGGSVLCSNTNFHLSVCSFECDTGYDLSGAPKSTCEDDNNGDEEGKWSSPPPTCSIGACKPPRTDPLNGFVVCDNGNEFGSVCTYTCNPGYYMVHSTRTILTNDISTRCQADKSWSRAPPTCQPITCVPPHLSLVNGEVDCTNSNIYRSDCTFQCDNGYVLVPGRGSLQSGSPYIATCEEDFKLGDKLGKWSDEAPTCKAGVCLPPKRNPSNGEVSCTNGNIMGSICTYTCNAGYYMLGSNLQVVNVNNLNAKCLPTLDWDNDEPSCLPITCEPPHRSPPNGEVTCSNRNLHESECDFECEPGYDLSGSPLSVCQDDKNGDEFGEWSHPAPTCTLGACKPPRTDPDNGRVTCNDGNNFDSVCTYTCNPGYYMVHTRRTVSTNDIATRCQADKTWSRNPPTCEPITCIPPFRSLRSGSVTCSNRNIYQSICEFECDSGFDLVPAPTSILSGLPYISKCNEDNVLGDELGAWSNDAPSCERGVCNPPRRNIRNGKISCSDGNRMGSVCSYICDAGFYMMGSDISVITRNSLRSECLRTLQWDVDEPTCEPITCEPPHSDPSNGQVDCTKDNFYLSECTFKCDKQYLMDGSKTSECQDDGNGDPIGVWSNPAPTCIKNFCDPEKPADPVNGYKVCTDANNLGSVCEFACDDYHRRVGPLYSRCVKDGRGNLEWSNPTPTCEPNLCKDRGELAHGEKVCTKDNFATSVCTYECTEKGYNLYPATLDTNQCMNDTHWDKRKPCCTRPCPPNAEMDAVFVLDSSSSVGLSNFLIMKDFVRGILDAFTVADDASRFSVLRYNKIVDEKNLIYLNSFSNSKEGLLDAYDKLPYDGSGTHTGKALKFVRDKIFTRSKGDRPRAPNLVIVMTDGRSQDLVKEISDSLRNEHNAFIFVVGIKPPNPNSVLDLDQLLDIAGTRENLMMADQGFESLTGEFALELTTKVCGDPCDHKTHEHQIDNEDDGHDDH